ncbi:MAG: glycosyl hydrolase family 18 protein [Acidobacteriota bacterium]
MNKQKTSCLLLCCLLIISVIGCNAAKKPITSSRPMVGGYYVNEPYGVDSLPSLKAHSDILNEISPLWYHVKPDGSLAKDVNAQAISSARQNKVKIIPLVNLVPSSDEILKDKAAQDRAIVNLANEVKKYKYDGINIDFEFIPDSQHKDFSVDRDLLSEFVRKVANDMKSMGKETQMAVLPHVGVSPEMAGVYDYRALAPYLSKVTIMCYDHSQEGSPPGPIAPFSWVEKSITTTMKQGFKAGQVCLGVATYGYDWPAGKAGGFTRPSKEILKQVARKGYEVKWSDKYQEPYYVYTSKEGTTREVWFENSATLQTKLNLVKKYKIAGIYIWRLGFEDKKFWDKIEANWGKK